MKGARDTKSSKYGMNKRPELEECTILRWLKWKMIGGGFRSIWKCQNYGLWYLGEVCNSNREGLVGNTPYEPFMRPVFIIEQKEYWYSDIFKVTGLVTKVFSLDLQGVWLECSHGWISPLASATGNHGTWAKTLGYLEKCWRRRKRTACGRSCCQSPPESQKGRGHGAVPAAFTQEARKVQSKGTSAAGISKRKPHSPKQSCCLGGGDAAQHAFPTQPVSCNFDQFYLV